ncbi:hypothetical protein Tco_0561338 [Tanacetum coccineum]
MTGDRSRLRNFVKKFIGIVRFRNDHFGAIMGYGDYVIGDSVISRVYYVEGLGHNLFSWKFVMLTRVDSGNILVMFETRMAIHSRKGLVPNPVPGVPYVPPTNKELEILFQLMFDEYFEPPLFERLVFLAPTVSAPVNSAADSTLSWKDNPFGLVDNPILHKCICSGTSSDAASYGILDCRISYVSQTFIIWRNGARIPMDIIIGIPLDTMADLNNPADTIPAEQAPAIAPPTITDDQILPLSKWVPIGKSDSVLDVQKSQRNPIFLIVLAILKNTNFFRAFTASSTIPVIYIQQFWDTIDALDITPANDNNPFEAPPLSDTIIEYVNTLGYPSMLRNVSAMSVNALYQPWRAILSMINMCLTSKTAGFDRPRHPVLQILWGNTHHSNIDYAERI